VEYRITEFGKTLIPILEALCDWGADYLGIENESSCECLIETDEKS
jgi:DNA-binding HxlR family transcriptional regulator